jgi:hypothetical protein
MKFLKNGRTWSTTNNRSFEVYDKLPQGNYTVCKNENTGEYFLEQSEAFTLPTKFYGKVKTQAKRILKSFSERTPDSQLGVLLSGLKGSGKTLLAKYLAVESGLPVIIVNTPFKDEGFMRTIQSIEQEAVVMWDEFEKLYDESEQELLLTLFDGVYTARNKIMILTCNNIYSVREFFHNRPSRIRYSISFGKLDRDFIEVYCSDNLNDKSYLEGIMGLSASCQDFNFDMLQILVDEINKNGGTIEEIVEILNIKPIGHGAPTKWKVALSNHGNEGREFTLQYPSQINDSPLHIIARSGEISIVVRESLAEDEHTSHYVDIKMSDLTTIDPKDGSYIFCPCSPLDGTKFFVHFREELQGGPNYKVAQWLDF